MTPLLNILRALPILWGGPLSREAYRDRLATVEACEEFDRWLVAVREIASHLRDGGDEIPRLSFVLPGEREATRVQLLMRHNTPLLNPFWTGDPVGHFELWYGGRDAR